jgi:predicted RNA-binding protein YlqC (UPF0109 family)
MEFIDSSDGIKDLLTSITQRLVDHPDQVSVLEQVGPTTMIFELSVDKEDVGQVIGKRGHTVGAIRTIMMSAAGKHGKRVYVEVKE